MNFTIDREILLEKLNIISHGLPSKSPMKVMEGIKIDVTDNDLFLTASNSDISIEILVKDSALVIQERGKTVVPGKTFIDLIKAFDSRKITFFLIEDKMLMIKADRKEYRINIMDPNDYPNIDFVALENPFKINCLDLKKAIEETVFACANTNKNPMLLGVNFKNNANKLTLTATNSYRLSLKTLDVETYDPFEITVPAKSLDELEKILESYEESLPLEIYLAKNKILVKFNDVLFQTRLLDGNFPDTSNVCPKEKDTKVIVRFNKDELQTAVNRIAILSPIDKEREREMTFSAVVLKIDQNYEVELSSANIQGAGKEILIPIDIKAYNPLVIGFSSKYLLEALKVLPGNEIEIAFIDGAKQFVLKSVSDNTLLEIILPFRLEN